MVGHWKEYLVGILAVINPALAAAFSAIDTGAADAALDAAKAARDRAVSMKLNIIPDVVRDKRIVIVEDSVVRGTTTRSKMRAIRRAGSSEIHLRVSCPPIRHPCFYGIDFPTSEELIAHCKRLIASYKCPRTIETRDALPLSGAGKILKTVLRKPFWEGRDTRVG